MLTQFLRPVYEGKSTFAELGQDSLKIVHKSSGKVITLERRKITETLPDGQRLEATLTPAQMNYLGAALRAVLYRQASLRVRINERLAIKSENSRIKLVFMKNGRPSDVFPLAKTRTTPVNNRDIRYSMVVFFVLMHTVHSIKNATVEIYGEKGSLIVTNSELQLKTELAPVPVARLDDMPYLDTFLMLISERSNPTEVQMGRFMLYKDENGFFLSVRGQVLYAGSHLDRLALLNALTSKLLP